MLAARFVGHGSRSAGRLLTALIACLSFAADARAFLDLVEVHRDGILGVEELDGVIAVAVSPDGRHVYAAGAFDDAIAGFERDAASGALTRVGFVRDGVDGVEGLAGVYGLAPSPDGRHLYAVSQDDGAVAVFARDVTTGVLSFVEAEVGGFGSFHDVAVSPDGRHVYAVRYAGGVVAQYARNAATGALTFVTSWQDGAGGVTGTDGANSIAVSPDGENVYVAGALDAAIAVFGRDAATGSLAFEEAETGGLSGTVYALVVAPDGAHVFAVDGVRLLSFARDPASGALTFARFAEEADGFSGAWGVAVSPDGGAVYVASGIDDAVSAVFRNLGFHDEPGMISFIESRLDGSGGFDGLDGANAAAVSPDGQHVYVCGFDEDALAVLAAPALRPIAETHVGQNALGGLLGVTSLALDATGRGIYAAGNAEDALAAFARDRATGGFQFLEREVDGVGASGLDGVTSVAVAGSTHVYVASSADDAVAVFAIDPATRELGYLEQHVDGFLGVDGLDGAAAVAVSPDGRHVYAGSTGDGAIVRFTRSAGDGSLGFAEAAEAGGAIRGLTLSADGASLYASLGDRVDVYDRDAGTGALTWVDEEIDGVGDLLLGGAGRAAVSPDGAYVYVPAALEDAVMIFARDGATGALTAVDAVFEAMPGVSGLIGVAALALTPDGKRLFAASTESAAVVLFERDVATGGLAFARAVTDGEAGYESLNGAIDLAVTGGGSQVVVAARDDNALTVLATPEAGGAVAAVAALCALVLSVAIKGRSRCR